jgi:hypothetical protein
MSGGSLQLVLPRESSFGERVSTGVAAAAPFVAAGVATGSLAADHGGYWPTAWGWAALAFAWLAGLALVIRERRISRLELAWAAGLLLVVAWMALSWFWTGSRTQTVLEVERGLVYVLAAVAFVALTKSTSYRILLWGAWAGATLACLYGLATRLFPDRFNVTDPIAGYRLSSPIGYWNGLGLLATLALTLAVGLAMDGPILARALAGASTPMLAATLYFTFSRGGWIALAAALVTALVFSPRRLALAAGLLFAAGPVAAAVWLAYRAKPLRLTGVPLDRSVHAGHTLAWELVLVAALAAALALGYAVAASTLYLGSRARGTFVAFLVVAVICGAVAVVHYGGPGSVISHARSSLEGPGSSSGSDLNSRLFSLSNTGRFREWRVALDEWHAHSVLGGGAGTFAQHWAAAGNNQGQVLNAHSLYLETLGELGPFGLVLLCLALPIPLAAALLVRGHSLVPIAAGAYVAWLVHVAYDWDWQLPGVTMVALVSAAALLVASRRRSYAIRARASWGLFAVVVAVGTVSLFGLLGNRALARTGDELRHGNVGQALSAARAAHRWAPWSSEPYAALAAVRRAQGDRAGERAAYRQAVAKDPRDWELWLELYRLSAGTDRAQALAHLARLNPGVAAAVRAA